MADTLNAARNSPTAAWQHQLLLEISVHNLIIMLTCEIVFYIVKQNVVQSKCEEPAMRNLQINTLLSIALIAIGPIASAGAAYPEKPI